MVKNENEQPRVCFQDTHLEGVFRDTHSTVARFCPEVRHSVASKNNSIQQLL